MYAGSRQVAQPHPGRALWVRWVVAMTFGELLGFAIPAMVGVLAAVIGLTDQARYLPLVIAGAGEGAVLALAQWWAFHRFIPELERRDWVIATALAAAFAWSLALLPSSVSGLMEVALPVRIVGGVVLALAFVTSIGGAQWFVLRQHVARAGWWVLANAIAWPVGVAVPVVALSLLPDDASALLMSSAGLVGGLLMGTVVGALTGGVLVWLLSDRLAARSRGAFSA
ncbi:MAG TPA: hypothetical protein VFZ66_13220 [Herpetosiphonaceae bacterium]